jgi:ribosomal 50S subunit-recycling heat shock protein
MCAAGRVLVNDKVSKPGAEVKVGDVLEIGFGGGATKVRIKAIAAAVRKEEAADLYEIL